MENVNRVVLGCNLTRGVELRSVAAGSEVATLRAAFTTRARRGGEWVDVPNYITIEVWGPQATSCQRYLSKGSGLTVDGSLRFAEWTGRDDVKRSEIRIRADRVYFQPNVRREAGAGGEAPPSELSASGGEASLDHIPF